MTDTLYRWVKASERPVPKDYSKINFRDADTKAPVSTLVFESAKRTQQLEFVEWLEPYTPSHIEDALKWFDSNKRTMGGIYAGEYIDRQDFEEFIQSLPLPSPGDNQSLEEAAKGGADYYVKMQGYHERPDITHHDYSKGFIDGALYERAHESEMKRLYDWIMDENRKPAIFAFTSGWLRNVAKEIEFRLTSRPSIDIVDQLREECPIGRGMAWEDGYVAHWNECCDKLLELLNGKK